MDRRRFLAALAAGASTALAQSTDRPFRLGFTPLPASNAPGKVEEAFITVASYGDIASFFLHDGIPWPIAEQTDDLAAYPALLRDYLLLYQSARRQLPGHKISVAANVIHHYDFGGIAPYWGDFPNQPLPPDWAGRPFNDERVKRATLNHLTLLARLLQPDYLTIGVEVNLLFARHPFDWPAYVELHRYLYRNLKERFPSININYSVLYENMLGLGIDAELFSIFTGLSARDYTMDAVAGLRDATDGLGVSTYPFMVRGLRPDPDYYAWAALLSAEKGLPWWIEQTGHPSRPLQVGEFEIAGSEEDQSAFFAYLFDRARVFDPRHIVNWVPRDYGTAFGEDLVNRTWASTGLWNEDGSPKPALRLWEEQRALPLRAGR